MKASSRLVLNTLAQYVRTAANVVLSLIATRLILNALGSSDYGIYTLVAGVVSMLSFFTNALTSTTQRYLSYNHGFGEVSILRSYYINSILLHLILGLILVGIMIIIEPLLFNGFLNISVDRVHAAKIVYITVISMLFIALMSSPFKAVILSHENIIYLSVVDILDGVMKLAIGYLLYYFDSSRLIWYAVLMMGVSIFNFLSYGIYGYFKYKECKSLAFRYISISKIKELTSFAGWTIYGTLCLFGRVQGLAIVLNKFFGTIINAAYGVSLQINSALGSISGALQTALSPQLIKAEGANNRHLMLTLSELGCKMSFIFLSFIGVPLIFDIRGILTLWLGNVPDYTGFFCTILVLSNLFDQLTVGFNITMNAIGNIKNFMLVVNTLKFLTTFLVAGLLWIGAEMPIAFSSYVIIEVIGCVLRIRFCKKFAGLNVRQYAHNVLLRLSIPVLILCLLYWGLHFIHFSLLIFFMKLVVVSAIYAFFIYKLGLNEDEKNKLVSLFKSFRRKKA